jgi:hypothetical protein
MGTGQGGPLPETGAADRPFPLSRGDVPWFRRPVRHSFSDGGSQAKEVAKPWLAAPF